jgi:hypothetical protein
MTLMIADFNRLTASFISALLSGAKPTRIASEDCRTAESYCRDLENTLEMEREVYFYLSID